MNSYNAIRTAGTTQDSDYTWKISSSISQECHVELARNCDPDSRSYAISRRKGAFDVFIGGIQSGLFDHRQRAVPVSVAYIGITQEEVKALVIFAIERKDEFDQALNASIIRNSPAQWDVNWPTVASILESAKATVSLNPETEPIRGAWEKFYTAPLVSDMPTPDELARATKEMADLVQELKQHSLSESDGLKLLMSRNPSQKGYVLARGEADRFFWSEGQNIDLTALREKKTPKKIDGPKPPFGRPSQPSTQPTYAGSKTLNSASGPHLPKKLFTICAILVVLLLTVGLINKCKKKEDDRQDDQPPISAEQESNQN